MESVASRYGLALYSLAMDKNKILEWQEEVKELTSILKENTDFIMVLGSSFITLKERLEMVDKSFVGVDEEIIALIKVVMENNRMNIILDIFESFNSYCNEYRGVCEGVLQSLREFGQGLI